MAEGYYVALLNAEAEYNGCPMANLTGVQRNTVCVFLESHGLSEGNPV